MRSAKSGKNAFSIVEVLIALVLVAGVGTLLVKVMLGSLKSQTNVRNISDFQQVVSTINLLSQTAAACDSAFRANATTDAKYSPPPPVNITGTPPYAPDYAESIQSIYFGKTPLIELNKPLDGGLKFTTIEFLSTGIVQDTATIGSNIYDRHWVTLHLHASKGDAAGVREMDRVIPMTILTTQDAAKTVKTCGAAQSAGSMTGAMRSYTPTAEQDLTTTFADLAGMSITFQPTSATSRISVSFSFQSATTYSGGSYGSNGVFKLLRDGVDVPNKVREFVAFQMPQEITYVLDSWGTTPSTLKLQGRSYNAVNTSVHKTHNGTQLVDASIVIQEFP